MPDNPSFDSGAARAILSLDFREEDHARMEDLAKKAQEGTLTSLEQEEIDSYERAGHLLSLLHSKARTSLKKSGDGSP